MPSTWRMCIGSIRSILGFASIQSGLLTVEHRPTGETISVLGAAPTTAPTPRHPGRVSDPGPKASSFLPHRHEPLLPAMGPGSPLRFGRDDGGGLSPSNHPMLNAPHRQDPGRTIPLRSVELADLIDRGAAGEVGF